MKKYILLFFLFIGFVTFAQETQNENRISAKAEFPDGDSAFSQEYLKMIHAYIDLGKYAVNGQFVFIFDINSNGKISNLDVLPKVKNSEMFIEDMQFAIKRVKQKWKPAIKEGIPVVSKKLLKSILPQTILTMIRKILFLLSIVTSALQINAQVLYNYPKGQDFYEGGRKGLFEDIQQVVVKNNIKPCEKTEALFMRFIVYPDSKVKYVADDDTNAVENNKCLKSKVLEVIKQTNNWKPAEIDGKKTPAMFCTLFSDDLLLNNKPDEEDFSKPVYVYKDKESDIMKFRENFVKCFDVNGYRPNSDYSFVINFDVDTNGNAGFFYIENQSNLEKFNEMVVKCASNTKKSYWKPGYYKGVPIKQIFRMPIRFNAN